MTLKPRFVYTEADMGSWKNVLAFVAALFLLAAAFRYGMRAVSDNAKRNAPPPEPAEWASWKEERFDDLGFSLRHPADSPVIAGADPAHPVPSMLVGGAVTRFTVKVPKTRYAGTKFVDAFVSVAAGDVTAGSEQDRQALCFLLAPEGSGTRPLAGRDEVRGTTFGTGGVSNAVGGLRAESVVRHAWFKGHCIEVTENLFSLIGGRVKDFDRVDAWKQMDDVTRTFRPLAP
ncbi:MAG: hypothetical protein RL272_116 [Candidatus Parcubacteria bacterium]|jgi:hypothetical protein